MGMTKDERNQLRTLIRQRFKLLKADVATRQAELEVELNRRVEDKYAAQDKAWDDTFGQIGEVARAANREANDLLRKLNIEGHPPVGADWNIVIVNRQLGRPVDDRADLRRRGLLEIQAKVRAALVELERQENQLLTDLMLSTFESAEAQAFLAKIPTVSELVPAERLLAIVGPIEEGQAGD